MRCFVSLCRAGLGSMAALAMLLCHAGAQDKSQSKRPEFKPRTVVNRTFPPIVDAPVIQGKEVTKEVSDHELVIGVVVSGEARAYPINMLTGPSREIINDTLGGREIAATW